MKFIFHYFNDKSALHIAVEKGNIEVVKLLLKIDNIDVNLKRVFTIIHLHNFNYLFKFHFKL